MERVLKLCAESFQEKVESPMFSKFIIFVSLLMVFARDMFIYNHISQHSEEGRGLYIYFTVFFYIQIPFIYVPWIMLCILFYPSNEQVPEEFKYYIKYIENACEDSFKWLASLICCSGKLLCQIHKF